APLPPMPPPPPRRRVGLLSYVAVALVAGALGAGSVVALYHPASNSTALPSSSAPPRNGAPAPLPSAAVPMPSSGGNSAAGGSLTKVGQGVVIINTALQYSGERAAGTGMVINAARGLVLTNNHVIENSTKISATVATGKNFQARVVGYDVTGDIALIQLQNPSGLHQVPLGDSSKVKEGDAVTALGNAQGRSQIVSAPGRITGVNRTITASDQGGTVTSETLHGMFQTDAGIVSGDSGGPLVNAAGQVIGMDTAGNDVRMPDQQAAAGFAIPVNTALSVAREIAAGHASSTISIGYPPFIGIYVGQGASSDPQQQAQEQQQQNNNGFGGFGGGNGFGGNGQGQSCYTNDSDLPVPDSIAQVSSGTLVIGTICASPAANAGVTAGSVITSVSGQAVGAPATLHTALSKFRPGDTVSLTWITPSGQHKTASMTLKEGPPQ
ncbi:MAG TPA: trypsin-like peptidase domain-containing protein, partial [Streptosporangiaceae bacterium]